MLTSATDHKSSEKLKLLDAIQRLGISYHFEGEIEEALKQIYQDFKDDGNLGTVALRFRLLRQQAIMFHLMFSTSLRTGKVTLGNI
ncbi:hypothetical protein GH714_015060 [Hevea brasiliensis]|uniref:Terpene synthase N-terminal domain-containing protein n=1 Tax=Hevea brasiliensis TaxID=3981 RepID=A0A6A6KRX2_HEVBR|nr:hypothetical protein GH714_015060 [Hevea brasiliensis]